MKEKQNGLTVLKPKKISLIFQFETRIYLVFYFQNKKITLKSDKYLSKIKFLQVNESLQYTHITHNSPKYLEWNLVLRKIGNIFSTKILSFKLLKMPKSLNFRFPEGWYFLNCDNAEPERSSNINISVSERHRWALVG